MKKTIDDTFKARLLEELGNRFSTSMELEAYIKAADSCCGHCKELCMNHSCNCESNGCCKKCPVKK